MGNGFMVPGGNKPTLEILTVGSAYSDQTISETKTFDIKSLLPEYYSALSTNNFAFSVVTCGMNAGDNAYGKSLSRSATRSYNASTGVLSVSMPGGWNGGLNGGITNITILCYYLKK